MKEYQIDKSIVNEVAELYSDPSIPIEDIINTYELNIPKNMLYKLLPPVTTKVQCIYCGSFMQTKRPSRTGNNKECRLICPNCNHVTMNNNQWECMCEKCVLEKKNILKKLCESKAKSLRDFLMEDRLVLLKLYFLLIEYGYYNVNYKKWFIKSDIINSRQDHLIIDELLQNNIVKLSPISSVSLFSWNQGEGEFPDSYYKYRVIYELNTFIDFKDSEDVICCTESFLDKLYNFILEPEILEEILKSLIENELYNFIIDEFEQRDICPHISDIGNEKMLMTLQEVGFQKAAWIYRYKAKNISDSLITNKITRKFAENLALGCGYQYVKFAIEKEWCINTLKIDQMKVSKIFGFFVNRMLVPRKLTNLLDLSYDEIRKSIEESIPDVED
ncbi:hypothetical protein lbkm_2621 [Lachnospiraceae bacterium KM106-2]|nr:hypothetical protein lbkm_2621 [Lachnospiraceae bacterium KM106-2]